LASFLTLHLGPFGPGGCRNLIISSLGFLLLSCTTTEIESYQRVPSTRAAQAYVKPGVSFKRYRRLYPQRLEIYYPKGAPAPAPEDLERIRAIFRTAFLAALDGRYEIANQPAEDALGVRASLVYFQEGADHAELQLGGKLRSLVVSGQLTFFMELSDSVTGEVLARAADPDQPAVAAETTRKDSSAGDVAENASWSRVEAAAARWASRFREFLDDNLGE
jgi:Protein of unknown function (DUF3313)